MTSKRLFRVRLSGRVVRCSELPPNVLRSSVGRGAKGRVTEEEAATQFCVELSRLGASWSLNKQLKGAR